MKPAGSRQEGAKRGRGSETGAQLVFSSKQYWVHETGRVARGDRSHGAPADPDLPAKEPPGSSSHDFAMLPAKPRTTPARGRSCRSSNSGASMSAGSTASPRYASRRKTFATPSGRRTGKNNEVGYR
jgi:hypothetical protein